MFYHHLLTFMLFQTGMSLFLLLNAKEDILKNAGYRIVADTHWLLLFVSFFILWKSVATSNCLATNIQ